VQEINPYKSQQLVGFSYIYFNTQQQCWSNVFTHKNVKNDFYNTY